MKDIVDMFDMSQYDDEEIKEVENCILIDGEMTEDEKKLDDFLNEYLETIDLIKER